MDLWVAAAAAGAGYLAKYWQSTLKKEGGDSSKQDSLDSADEKPDVLGPLHQRIGRKTAESGSHLFRSLIRRQAAGLSFDADERHSEGSCTGVLPERTDPSRRTDGDKLMRSEEYVRDDSSLLSLQPWIFRKENYQEDGEKMKEIGEYPGKCDYNMGQYTNALQPHLSPRNAGPVHGFRRNKSSLRSRKVHKNSVKPLSSTENCLIPQLHKDSIDFEEYVYSPFPSPSSLAVRPFLVTDGKQIISKSSFESLHEKVDNGLHQHVNSVVDEVVIGVPPLQTSRKPKRKCEEAHQGRLSTYDSQHCSKMSQLPGVERVLFFCLGLNVGLMSNVQSNNRVVEKLSVLLKHSENLVQDLQEELEMKNSLVVEELVHEVCQDDEHHDIFHDNNDKVYSPRNCGSKFPSPQKQRDILNPPCFPRADGEKETLSTIEAELEAELERLELNMNASSLEGRISALAELEPGLIGNVVHGELREEVLNGKSRSLDSDGGDTNGSSTTPHMGNYSVSPRELSLRLHEIIQSQLEERIKDLETALYLREKELNLMEDEKVNSRGEFSSSEQGTSSNQGSPVLMDQGQEIHHPVCLNLSGDALDAYNEAYEEFLRMTNAEEENPSSTTNMSLQIDGDELCSSDQSLSSGHEVDMANETSVSDVFGSEPTWKHIPSGQLCSEEASGVGEVEDDEIDDDEEGKMLIQQIVERTRQGSPIVLNAKKILSLWTNN